MFWQILERLNIGFRKWELLKATFTQKEKCLKSFTKNTLGRLCQLFTSFSSQRIGNVLSLHLKENDVRRKKNKRQKFLKEEKWITFLDPCNSPKGGHGLKGSSVTILMASEKKEKKGFSCVHIFLSGVVEILLPGISFSFTYFLPPQT